MTFSDFDLEKTATLNHMGLTATVAGEKGLICGWDGSEYTVETESGRRIATADFVWEYDSLASEDVMDQNAKLAAMLSNDSPYRERISRLEYDKFSGEWTAALEDEGSDVLESESDPEFGNDEQDESGLMDKLAEFFESFENSSDEVLAGEMDHPAMKALPFLLICATDPELDATDIPEVQEFIQHLNSGGDEHVSHTKYSQIQLALPIVEGLMGGTAAAEGGAVVGGAAGSGGMMAGLSGMLSKIPGASRAGGLINTGLKGLGLQSVLGPLIPGGGEQQNPIQVQRPTEFGYTNASINDRVGDARDHFGISLEQKVAAPKDQTGVLEAMRAKVLGILQGVGGNTQNIGFDPDAVWYVLMNAAQVASSIVELQSIVQCIPPDLHNSDPNVPQIEETTPPLTLPSPNPGGSGNPKIPGASPGPEPAGPGAPALGGGPLVPGGPTTTQGAPLPPGSAPGGGLPGGPGRRAPMRGGSVKTAGDMRDQYGDPPSETNLNIYIDYLRDYLSNPTGEVKSGVWNVEYIPTQYLHRFRNLKSQQDLNGLLELYEDILNEHHDMKGGEGSLFFGKTADWNGVQERMRYDHKDMGEPGDARVDAVEGDLAGVTTTNWLHNYPVEEQPFLAAVDKAKRRGLTDGDIVTYLTDDPWYDTEQGQKHGGMPSPQEILYYIKEVESHYAQPTHDEAFMKELGVEWPKDSSVRKSIAIDEGGETVTDLRTALKVLQAGIGGVLGVSLHEDDMEHFDAVAKEEDIDRAIEFVAQAGDEGNQDLARLAQNLDAVFNQGAPPTPQDLEQYFREIEDWLREENVPEGIEEPQWDFSARTRESIQAPYPPLGGQTVQQPGTIPPVQFGAQPQDAAADKAKLDQLVQQYIGSGMSMPDAYARAAMDVKGVAPAPGQGPAGSTAQPGMTPAYAKVANWKDIHGEPLKVDTMYKMTRPDIPVPDFVRVTWVEPENIRVKFANNDDERDIDTQDYSFEPLVDDAREVTSSAEDPLAWVKEGSSTDEPLVDPNLAQKFAGKNFSHPEQREFIDEPGEARNRDRLNLNGTHYDAPSEIKGNPGVVGPEQFLFG